MNDIDTKLADELTELFQERADAVPRHVPPAMTMPGTPATNRRRVVMAAAALLILGLGGAAMAIRYRTATIQTLEAELEVAANPDHSTGDAAAAAGEPDPAGGPAEAADAVAQADIDSVLNDMAVNQPILVVTGADWCPSCQQTLPDLIQAIQAEVPEVPVVGVAAAGDTIWDQTDWPFATVAISTSSAGSSGGDDAPVVVNPTGMQIFPGVGFWTSDGLLGPAVSGAEAMSDGWLTDGAQRAVAARPEYGVFQDVVALALPVPNDQRPALRAMNGLANSTAEACGSDERRNLDETSGRFDQATYADLGLITERGLSDTLLQVVEPEDDCYIELVGDGDGGLSALMADWAETVDRVLDSEPMRSLEPATGSCLTDGTGIELEITDEAGEAMRPTYAFFALVDGADATPEAGGPNALANLYVKCTDDYFNQLARMLRAERPRFVAENQNVLATLSQVLIDSGYTPHVAD